MTALLLALALLEPPTYPRPDLLAEPAELVRQAADARGRLLDVRPAEAYQAGHIPGAVRVDSAAWGKAFTANPDAAAWAKRLGQLGIDPTKRIVVYGDDLRDSARIWWLLRYWGAADARLLNGGFAGWKAAGGPVNADAVALEPSTVTLTPQATRHATKAQLLTGLKADAKPQILDARSTAEHCGTEGNATRKGAIPGAVHLEWKELLDAKTGRFKPPAELNALVTSRGIDLNKPAITYCQSGGRAAVLAFSLELLGGQQVSNYYRSWSEWGNYPETPVVVKP